MSKLFSDIELSQRSSLRKVFHKVDGETLVMLSSAQGPFSDLAKGKPSSIYPIPMRPINGSDSIMDFGPSHDPELAGRQFEVDSGMLVWCGHNDGQPFAELAKLCGCATAYCRTADIGTFINVGSAMDNDDVILLAMKMVKALISAFEITEQERSRFENLDMRTDPEILPGKPDSRSQTI